MSRFDFSSLRFLLCAGVVMTILLAAAPLHAKGMATPATPPKKGDITNASLPPQKDSGIRLIGDLDSITTKYEDTLVHLARRYNIGFVELRAANPGVDPWLPGAGTRLTIPTQHILPDAPHEGVVINLSEMRLYHYYSAKEPPATYPIGIGRTGLTTPLGSTTVARMATDPIWFPTDRMRKEDPELPAAVPPGPENPMGTHALYLGWPSYAIHGTDKPYSIGRRLSSGCIRMYPEDILTLFDNVAPSTKVTVVDQPIKTAWVDDRFFIQVHPTQEQSDILSRDAVHKPKYPLNEDDVKLIIAGAGVDADKLDWAKVRQAIRERRGVPIIVANRTVTPGAKSARIKGELLPETKTTPRPGDKPTKKEITN